MAENNANRAQSADWTTLVGKYGVGPELDVYFVRGEPHPGTYFTEPCYVDSNGRETVLAVTPTGQPKLQTLQGLIALDLMWLPTNEDARSWIQIKRKERDA